MSPSLTPEALLAMPRLEAHALLAGSLETAFAGSRSPDDAVSREACRLWDATAELFFAWMDRLAADPRAKTQREFERLIGETLEHLHGIDGVSVRQKIIDQQLRRMG